MSKPKQKDDPSQDTFFFCPPIITTTADGFTIKLGKPQLELTPKQLASRFSVSRETIYLWRQQGIIPEEFFRPKGRRKIMFDAAVIPHLEAQFRKLHE